MKIILESSWGAYDINRGGFNLYWQSENKIMFGNVTFYVDKQGILKCQNEGLSKEQIYLLMKDFVNSATMEE